MVSCPVCGAQHEASEPRVKWFEENEPLPESYYTDKPPKFGEIFCPCGARIPLFESW